MVRNRKRKCKHCNEYFLPDARNRGKQRYCSKPECKEASKAASQKKWLKKAENSDYFRGPENVERVRKWRRKNPRYWCRNKNALQDDSTPKPVEKQGIKSDIKTSALQDDLILKSPVFIGLIANITGSALQDDIAVSLHRMRKLGMDVLNYPGKGENCNDKKNPDF